VRVREIADPRAFLAAAGPLLLADEARHNLLLGIAATLRDHPGHYPEHRLWVVEAEAGPVGAALRTPPHALALAREGRPGAAAVLAAAIDDELPGVVAARPEADAFAAAWTARTGKASELRFAQGIYALERVRPPVGVPGAMRGAAQPDRALAIEWWEAFVREAQHDEPADADAYAHAVDHRLGATDSGIALWEVGGEVCSLAAYGGPTPNGIRIGPVYTPPARRGRGYASALVAGLSAAQLAAGRRFCFLYTNLANATANKIYAQIGYERVCESAHIGFG
jgi:predicted GNAT family acetyltransferase